MIDSSYAFLIDTDAYLYLFIIYLITGAHNAHGVNDNVKQILCSKIEMIIINCLKWVCVYAACREYINLNRCREREREKNSNKLCRSLEIKYMKRETNTINEQFEEALTHFLSADVLLPFIYHKI